MCAYRQPQVDLNTIVSRRLTLCVHVSLCGSLCAYRQPQVDLNTIVSRRLTPCVRVSLCDSLCVYRQPEVDLNTIVSRRLTAMRQLQQDPHNRQAQSLMDSAQQDVSAHRRQDRQAVSYALQSSCL